MEISVVIPCYNREDSIRGAVLSVLNQLGDHSIEVIVVDDGSTDSSIDKIRDLDIKIYKTEGRTGACNARNLGILKSSNEVIAFNDSDDHWVIDKLLKVEETFNNNGNIDYLFHSFIRVKGNKSELGGGYLSKSSKIVAEDLMKKIITNNQISTQCLVIKKSVLDDIGGFDTNLGRFQDWELALRVCEKYAGYYIANPLSLCIESVDSISKSKVKGVIARRYILNKHMDLFHRYPKQMLKYKTDLFLRNIFVKIINKP